MRSDPTRLDEALTTVGNTRIQGNRRDVAYGGAAHVPVFTANNSERVSKGRKNYNGKCWIMYGLVRNVLKQPHDLVSFPISTEFPSLMSEELSSHTQNINRDYASPICSKGADPYTSTSTSHSSSIWFKNPQLASRSYRRRCSSLHGQRPSPIPA